jgi:hypothetical protein
MAFPRLKQFASMKGWRIEGNIAYGEENGYLFTVVDGQGFKMFLTPLPAIDDNIQKDILNYLKENKKMLRISEFSFDNTVLVIKFRESFRSTKVEYMDNLLAELTELLKQKHIKGKECCIFCGNDGADQSIYIDNIMYSAHNECYSHEVAAVEEAELEYKAEDKNYLAGFMGALVGGIVSSIPWILVQVYLNRIAAALALLIGIGSLKAYYLFKGRLGRATRWIVSACTLFSVVLSQFGAIAVNMLKNDIPLNYGNFVQVLRIPEVAHSFRSNLGMSLFMAFLGIIGLFLDLKGDAKSIMPNIEKK